MLPRTMQPHGQVVLRQPELLSDFRRLFSIKVDLLEQIAILLGNHGQQAFETLAQGPFILFGGDLGKLLLKTFQCAAASALPSVNINDGSSENAVKPCCGLFLVFGLSFGCLGFHQTFLNHVLGHVRVT